jgi:hypothetical protein
MPLCYAPVRQREAVFKASWRIRVRLEARSWVLEDFNANKREVIDMP